MSISGRGFKRFGRPVAAMLTLLVLGISLMPTDVQARPARRSETSATVMANSSGMLPADMPLNIDNWESLQTFQLKNTLRKPLRVYIETSSAYYKPAYEAYVKESLDRWSDALDGRLSYAMVKRRNDANVTVDWVSSFGDAYTAGMSSYGPGFAHVEMRTPNIPDEDLKANLMHELGHGLGIAGHSPYAGDIMQAVRRWRRDGSSYQAALSPHDVQAIRRLYSDNWKRGEDLYGATAQRVTAPVVAGGADVKSAMVEDKRSPSEPDEPIDYRGIEEAQNATFEPKAAYVYGEITNDGSGFLGRVFGKK